MRPATRTAVAGGLATALVTGVPLAAAAGSPPAPPTISSQQSVLVDASPAGTVRHARLFHQVAVSGDGHYVVTVPTSTSGWRNLDGFATPRLHDGAAVWDLDVHGRTDRRSVSDMPGDRLPLSVSARYTLDGKPVEVRDLAGRSGLLAATFTVRNLTGTPTPITYRDAQGHQVTETVDVVTPYVGQLSTTLPGAFRDVTAPRADLAGNGKGGTLAAWTMVLFSPIGETTQTFGYTARVSHLQLPSVDVQAVPVPPQRKPELAFGEQGFRTGTSTATQLVGGAGTIDGNLLKVRDGAGQLLDGLTKLADGAAQLHAGLAGSAVPGAQKLAAGAARLSSGAGRLASGAHAVAGGAGRVSAGSHQLSVGAHRLSSGLATADSGAAALTDGAQDAASGAGQLAGGSAQLAAGLDALQAGLAQLAGAVKGLPSNAGVLALHDGLGRLAAGIGSPTTPNTILWALAQVGGGLGQTKAGLAAISGGVQRVATGLAAAQGALTRMSAALGQQQAVLGSASAGLGCALATPPSPALCQAVGAAAAIGSGVKGGIDTQLAPGVQAALDGLGDASTPGTVLGGLAAAGAGIGSPSIPGTMLYGLTRAMGGLSHPAGALGASDPGGVAQGLTAVDAGLSQLVSGIVAAVGGAIGAPSDAPRASLSGAAAALGTGAHAVADGNAALADGTGRLALGSAQLSAGTHQLSAGSGQLDRGAATLAAGSQQLAAGSSRLDAGAAQVASGAHQVAGGNATLAAGLTPAASGAGRLADGLTQARAGAGKLRGGTDELHRRGTTALVSAGEQTQRTFARQAAEMDALDAKAKDGALPYPAPAGGTGSAAYRWTLAAATTQGRDSAGRALAAFALLTLAGGAGAVLRRRLTA